jgi:uracil-DNA glycosylase family protein
MSSSSSSSSGAPSAETLAETGISHSRTLRALREAAVHCRACPLWRCGTQTVFGEGAAHARVMLVGEQPGDQEDRQGHPFVGPAGGILNRALEEAGIDRRQTYVTNAVKHFKWVEGRGKRRIHQKPNSLEVSACRPWLLAEIELLKPEIVVCMGATAAQALLGRQFKVTQRRGELVTSSFAPQIVATVHPSSILRAPDDDTRHRELRRFVADLKIVANFLSARH